MFIAVCLLYTEHLGMQHNKKYNANLFDKDGSTVVPSGDDRLHSYRNVFLERFHAVGVHNCRCVNRLPRIDISVNRLPRIYMPVLSY